LGHLKQAIEIDPGCESDYVEPELPDQKQILHQTVSKKLKHLDSRDQPEEELGDEEEVEVRPSHGLAADRDLAQTKFDDPPDVIDPSLYIIPPNGKLRKGKKTKLMKLKKATKKSKKSLPKTKSTVVKPKEPITADSIPTPATVLPPKKTKHRPPTIDSLLKELEGNRENIEVKLLGTAEEKAQFAKLVASFGINSKPTDKKKKKKKKDT